MSLPPYDFQNKRIVITGASSGIGRAIAEHLSQAGAQIHALARQWPLEPDGWVTHPVDLAVEADIRQFAEKLHSSQTPVDVLIHSAGAFATGNVADFAVTEFDKLYAVNVRAPFLLSQLLLPQLLQQQGQIVFINSSAGVASKLGLAAYSATKFAIKSIADALRMEVNERGVRVMSVYPGKTASPMQALAHQQAGAPYHAEKLMQTDDVAQMVLAALALPRTAEMTDLHLRPMQK